MNILNKFTLKTLAKNKTRTIVTVVGIILSAAMITAVTTLVSSLQSFLVEGVKATEGNWSGLVYSVEKTAVDSLNNDEIKSYTSLENIGYSKLEMGENDGKPYLFIGGISDGFTDMIPIYMTSGRLPEQKGEIIVPEHLKSNGGITYKIGDVMELSVGYRDLDGDKLTQHNSYCGEDEEGPGETLKEAFKATYTVVGIYERPDFEEYSAPGYTCLTVSDGLVDDYDAYFLTNKLKDTYSYLDKNFPNTGASVNSNLLRFTGNSNEDALNSTLFGLAAILIAIIVLGSISLIYNAFSISVSERTKQFGILSSIGATKKQLTRSVTFEAFILSLIGLPLGILAGIGGIGITLKATEGMFVKTMGDSLIGKVDFKLAVSWQSVVIAAVIGLVTVLISSYIPSHRAVKVSAIEAIRQTSDIKIKANKVKTSGLLYKVFGFEGMLARKNFKRNKKKYRATVISLFLSVVLFISASSFCSYLSMGSGSIIEAHNYDLCYYLTKDQWEKTSPEELLKKINGVEGVDRTGMDIRMYYTASIPKDMLNAEYLEHFYSDTENDKYDVNLSIRFIDDETYNEMLKANGISSGFDKNNPVALYSSYATVFKNDGKYSSFDILKDGAQSVSAVLPDPPEGYEFYSDGYDNETGKEIYVFKKTGEQSAGEDVISIPCAEAQKAESFALGKKVNELPFFYSSGGIAETSVKLFYPYSYFPELNMMFFNANTDALSYYIQSENYEKTAERLETMLEDMTLSTDRLISIAENADTEKALLTIINVFSYGFITLISLIAAANVFNTISTNIGLRRREFAMLKSVGMTRKGFNKMMNYECLMYGLKGLVYGIPVALGITYLIYRAASSGWESSFYVPWLSVVIAVGSVFVVVFATMLYSMSKVKKDNPIDALKNENL